MRGTRSWSEAHMLSFIMVAIENKMADNTRHGRKKDEQSEHDDDEQNDSETLKYFEASVAIIS